MGLRAACFVATFLRPLSTSPRPAKRDATMFTAVAPPPELRALVHTAWAHAATERLSASDFAARLAPIAVDLAVRGGSYGSWERVDWSGWSVEMHQKKPTSVNGGGASADSSPNPRSKLVAVASFYDNPIDALRSGVDLSSEEHCESREPPDSDA